jgi:enoyl-CoA hydratase/carnithine racemase
VLVLEAAGKVFSAGHDLSELRSATPEQRAATFTACSEVMMSLRALPQPVIAQVTGLATAAGCQLVASCDLALASSEARFATPGVSVGLFCSTPAVPLVRAIGGKRALRMLLTGEVISAQTALEWGLVSHVAAPESMQAVLESVINPIIGASSVAVTIGKATFWAQESLSEAAAYEVASQAMAHNCCADDAVEGFSAFLQKRKPVWTGK